MHCFSVLKSQLHQQTKMAAIDSTDAKLGVATTLEFIKTNYRNCITTFQFSTANKMSTPLFIVIMFSLFLSKGPYQFGTNATKVFTATLRSTKMFTYNWNGYLLLKYDVKWLQNINCCVSNIQRPIQLWLTFIICSHFCQPMGWKTHSPPTDGDTKNTIAVVVTFGLPDLTVILVFNRVV